MKTWIESQFEKVWALLFPMPLTGIEMRRQAWK